MIEALNDKEIGTLLDSIYDARDLFIVHLYLNGLGRHDVQRILKSTDIEIGFLEDGWGIIELDDRTIWLDTDTAPLFEHFQHQKIDLTMKSLSVIPAQYGTLADIKKPTTPTNLKATWIIKQLITGLDFNRIFEQSGLTKRTIYHYKNLIEGLFDG